jgi:hypothetical protein
MTHRVEVTPPGDDTAVEKHQNPAPRKEITIAGFPLFFVLLIAVMLAGILMIAGKALGVL